LKGNEKTKVGVCIRPSTIITSLAVLYLDIVVDTIVAISHRCWRCMRRTVWLPDCTYLYSNIEQCSSSVPAVPCALALERDRKCIMNCSGAATQGTGQERAEAIVSMPCPALPCHCPALPCHCPAPAAFVAESWREEDSIRLHNAQVASQSVGCGVRRLGYTSSTLPAASAVPLLSIAMAPLPLGLGMLALAGEERGVSASGLSIASNST
jgi:hypothetical protein